MKCAMVVVSFCFSHERGESTIEPANNHGDVIALVAHIAKVMFLLGK